MKRLAAAVLGGCAACGALAVPPWLPVPGAPELAIEASSIEVRGPVVAVSVRGSPSQLLKRTSSDAAATGPRWHNAVLRLQFDCAQRQVRTAGVLGYDAAGKAVHSSALPSTAVPVPNDGVLDVLYDAGCELGRALRVN
ncbi:hypothetical protein [Ramlibacter humi]|uniref:Uncharacterized protein n=1 Tax=Ramlibacter humi TaxID=2530451 RepID=A0A4Z0BEI3_9BURK|nr:hypothetical protein [Ramlibacter humi]TFY97712.1 hypothetical protein EZ216_18495 [Ramlibacter humi]